MRSKPALLVALFVSALPASAAATDVLEFPGLGTQMMGRGGAWVARATSPLASWHNPAGLAGQRAGISADVAIVFNDVCFTRKGPGSTLQTGLSYPEDVCNEGGVQPLPALAGVFDITERLGIGLSIAPPAIYGSLSFPETVEIENNAGARQPKPSPQRYLLLESSGVVLNTTLSAGYEISDGVRVGAGFIWGIASYRLANANMSLSPSPQPDGSYRDPETSDVRAEVQAADWFIPGVVIGALASPLPELDVGASVRIQQAFDAHGDLETKANYWTVRGVSDNPTLTDSGDIEPGLAHLRLPSPIEAELGFRFHWPRDRKAPPRAERDPLVDDVFDVELDLSYAQNSVYEAVELRFPARPIIEVQGTGGQVPEDADMDLRVKGDSVGVRLGGDYIVLPARLAVRAGAWYEPDIQRPEYLNVAYVGSRRVGASLGAQVRLGFVDLEAAYMHVFFEDVDNDGNGSVRVVSGDASATPIAYRSPYPINGGRVTQSVNIVSVGATARF